MFKHGISEILIFLGYFLASVTSIILSLWFLTLIDTITGIWGAKKNKTIIESRKLGRIVTKIILFPLSIIVAKVAEQYLTPEIPWIRVTSGIIATIEIKSIFENINKILGYKLWDLIREKIWTKKDPD